MSDQNPNTNPTTPPETPPSTPAAADPAAIAQAVMQAIEARNQRNERSIVKSMADQHGLTEDELTAILDRAKADKARQLPPDVQRQIDEANRRAEGILLAAEVRNLGAAMGLVDADAALQLIDRSGVKVDGDKVTGMQEALNKLREGKGYLFGAAQSGQTQQAWGQQQGTGGGSDPEAAFRRALGLKPKDK